MKLKLLAACCFLVEGLAAAVPAQPAAVSKVKSAEQTSKSSSPADSRVAAPKAAEKSLQKVPSAPPQKRARLDVGFASFEKNMMEQILASIRTATESTHWSSKLQLACKDNVTQALSQGLKSQLASLKLSIGKTWMSLPEDEQKNAYVEQLRSAYEPVFNDTVGTIDSHLQRSLKLHLRVMRSVHKKAASQDELLKQCASSITGNILDERCYDLGGEQHLKKVNSFLEIKNASRKFCMPSVFEAMDRRLHDAQGLIGMTMQFEAKSLSLSAAPSAVDDLVKQVSAGGH